MTIPRTQRGQATSELLVSALVLVPMFVFVPLVGKYIDIKQKTQESSRYVVWERTVWSDPSASWNDGETSKDDATLVAEQNSRIFSHSKQGIDDSAIRENPLWRDGAGVNLLASRAGGPINESVVPNAIENGTVKILAYEGLPVPLLDDVNLQLGSKGYVEAETKIAARGAIGGVAALNYSSKATILSNAWAAPTEGKFRHRVDNLVHNELVDVIALPADVLSIFPLFEEGRDARPVEAAVDSRALPANLVHSE